MQIEKHRDALSEVYATLDEALHDPRGLLRHQRRIALMTSFGAQQLIELYFHRLHIIKPGAHIKHEWFKLEERNLKQKLAPVLTTEIAGIPDIMDILHLARLIESDRNEIAYGAPLKTDGALKEKVDHFLDLKNIIDATGGGHDSEG